MSAIVVLAPGFLTTVQDLGRPGHAAEGVSASGAADALALRIGNRLVGNHERAAGLELTIAGGSFRFDTGAIVALAGADAAARVGDRPLPPWRVSSVAPGETVACGTLRGGARAYLCVRGGIEVPLVFDSASTHLLSGIGGHEGRALVAGDRLSLGGAVARESFAGTVDPSSIPGYRRGEPFRATEGPQASWFAGEAITALYAAEWRVSDSCDRMGLRLVGPELRRVEPRELLTEGVCLGAIQAPSGGLPIVLSVEHQTTGGYPKIANIIAADLWRLGTLRPRDAIRFARATMDEARALLRAQEAAVDALFG